MMKSILLLALLTSEHAFAQEPANVTLYQTYNPSEPPVEGAPYSATITNKVTQTLADGSSVVQASTSTTARDSEGRTREDAPPPPVDDPSMSAPHLVFLRDPVAHSTYVLDLTHKTAQKASESPIAGGREGHGVEGNAMFFREEAGFRSMGAASQGPMLVTTLGMPANRNVRSDDLGSQTIEGLVVHGVRTTRTIPAGEIGNAKPIQVVSEVWTSPELKAVIYSKLSDPRIGEHIFQLTNIVRAEPEPSLFVVPPDFRIVEDGPLSITAGPRE